MTSATIKLFLPRGDAKSLRIAEIYPYAVAQRKQLIADGTLTASWSSPGMRSFLVRLRRRLSYTAEAQTDLPREKRRVASRSNSSTNRPNQRLLRTTDRRRRAIAFDTRRKVTSDVS
jgi:hypothetical protein